ncbi:MAG: class I SAM-dependent methyltransferase [Candidatus Nomurabacteria bacterium]|nr:class I SAM-dependent methyltransferase [Candidatus Nomurabacteria bacterium]
MILKTKKQKDYELLDSGNGEKLERYGPYILRRPDPEALWEKRHNLLFWDKAELRFVRNNNKTKWITKEGTPRNWNILFGDLNFSIRPTSFKHTGLFPEQLPNWQWTLKMIKGHQLKNNNEKKVSVLNLFGYTGGATLAAAKAGAEVCHVDGSKTAVEWARVNAQLSGLENAPIRWIVDDVLVFLKREIKRGRKYDAIIMDPPSFGHGPKDELWKIEEHFLLLMKLCKEVLSDDPLFIIINGYTAGYSSIAYENNLKDIMKEYKGEIEIGELVIEESNEERLLPCGIFARWSKI